MSRLESTAQLKELNERECTIDLMHKEVVPDSYRVKSSPRITDWDYQFDEQWTRPTAEKFEGYCGSWQCLTNYRCSRKGRLVKSVERRRDMITMCPECDHALYWKTIYDGKKARWMD